MVLCRLGQEDQVVEGKVSVTRPGSESKDGLRPGSMSASLRRLLAVFMLLQLLAGLSECEWMLEVGRGEKGLVWPKTGL